MEKEPYTQEDVTIANRSVNIAYILAGCLAVACEDMFKDLDKVNSGLKFENRQQVNLILNLSDRLVKATDKLYDISVLNGNDDEVYAYNCTKDQYYALLLKIIQILGSDEYSGARSWLLYNHLNNFKDLIKLPRLDYKEKQAFLGIKDQICKGLISYKKLRECLELKNPIDQ